MGRFFQRIFSGLTAIALVANSGISVYAATSPVPQFDASRLVAVSGKFDLPRVKGMEFYTHDPFKFRFVVDEGTEALSPAAFHAECEKIIKYFLTALTLPEDDLWVNLSPYEADRIATPDLAATELGSAMLAQDYFLKQLSSSLTCPQSESGAAYWRLAGTASGATTADFSKVWIAPAKIVIREGNQRAVIKESKLKVLMQGDELAMQKNGVGARHASPLGQDATSNLAFKQNILPLIEKDVNEGENFAQLRQIYASVALAQWFKVKLRETAWAAYLDAKKTKGVESDDPAAKEKIYQRYLQAFKQGAYDLIKKNYDPVRHVQSRRRYFSGGITVDTPPAANVEHDDGLVLPDGGVIAWSALPNGEILADLWPEDFSPEEKALRIEHDLKHRLRFSDIEAQLAEAVRRDPDNTITVTMDLGDGRRNTEVLPAGEKHRDKAIRWLASWYYNLVSWQGRAPELLVQVGEGSASQWGRQQFFDALRTRLAQRYNTDPDNTNRTLQSFGNYGRPIAIRLVDTLPALDLAHVTLADREFPKIRYDSPEHFAGTYVCFDSGGQSTKVAVLVHGKLIELPPDLAQVKYPKNIKGQNDEEDKTSAQDYVDTLEAHARRVNDYLREVHHVTVNSVFYNLAGAVEPVLLEEIAPGITVSGHSVFFANTFSHWSDSDRELARGAPRSLARIFGASVKAGNDMIGFASWLIHNERLSGGKALQGTLGSGYGTQLGDSLLSPQEGSHFEILLDDGLPRSCEQLGLSSGAVVSLAKAFGFLMFDHEIKPITGKLESYHVGQALRDRQAVNYPIAQRVFNIVGDLLAEHLYIMSRITGVKEMVFAGGVAREETGNRIVHAANEAEVARKHHLKVRMISSDVDTAGAIGGTYAASRQTQANIALLAQRLHVPFTDTDEDSTTLLVGRMLPELYRRLTSTDTSEVDLQEAAYGALALHAWSPGPPYIAPYFAQWDELYALAQRIYKPEGGPGSGGAGLAAATSSSAVSGSANVDGGVKLNARSVLERQVIGTGVKLDAASGKSPFATSAGCGYKIDDIVRQK